MHLLSHFRDRSSFLIRMASWGIAVPPLALASRHVANVLRDKRGRVRELSRDEHDRLRVWDRGQRKGALFSPLHPGFDPTSWQHVFRTPTNTQKGVAVQRQIKLEFEVEGAALPSRLMVVHPVRDKDYNWKGGRKAGKRLYGAANESRASDLMEGGMVGAGLHVTRIGGAITHYASGLSVQAVDGLCGTVYKLLAVLFCGEGVSFEDLPKCGLKRSPTFAVSRNLGNPAHFDTKDAFMGFAQWYQDDPQKRVASWWFLLPDHGVAIELQDGTSIAWEGASVCLTHPPMHPSTRAT